jgi:hypothetical protein
LAANNSGWRESGTLAKAPDRKQQAGNGLRLTMQRRFNAPHETKKLDSHDCCQLIFCGAAFGQTLQITGTVTAVTSTQITLQAGTDIWTINRTSSTTVVSGTLKPASPVTIQCNSVDAQKKELPTAGTPTPAAQ